MTSFAENTKYEVCFVQTGTSASDVTEKLQLAFEAMESNQIDPVWISTQECLQITKKEPKLFVIDPFEGEVYEHLKSVNCRIVGPLCILYCLKCEDVLPKRPYPVYSVSMRKITVSCSNIDTKSREDINKKVELMGGFFSKDLTKSVTHLVVGEVGSKKYQVAASCGLLIMVPDWVNAVWENGQHALLHATDSSFDKYKCPVFKGLIITVSQLSAEERAAIKSLVERNGGIYMGALKARETTHLVLSEPSGDKYRYARNWKVFCVNVSWIYDSTEAGYCKDETLYMIDENSKPFQPKRSTPKKDFSTDDLPFPLVDCSAITNISVITHLNETIRSDTSGPVHRKTSFSALEAFDLSLLPKYGQFLDGCKIFLTGFSPAHIDKLRKVVNAGGGIRFSKYSDSISHVVCGELGEDFLQNLKSSTVKPYVVNCNWLLECCKKEKLVEEKPFLCMDISHLSPEKVEPESKEIGPNKSINSLSKNESITGDNITDIFKQYINHETIELQNLGTVNDKKIDKSIESHDGTKSVDKEKERDTLRAGEEDDGVLDVNEEDEVTSSKELFTGLKFTVAGFGDKDSEILATMIETHSGMVLHDENIHSCDIAIVPIIWSDNNIFVPHILTNCWLQKCIEDCRLYDFDENELFRPLTVPLDKKPFQSFVISVSQYSGTERDCLMYLAEALGAVCQEYFVRRANKSKGVLSNTHLIVATPEGSKYEAAKKWNIPAVTKQWVLDAAKHGTVPPISKYMVEAAALPIEHDTKSALSSKNATIEKMNGASTHEKFNCIGTPISERNHISEPTDEIEQNNQKAVSIPVINSDKPLNKTSELDQSCKINAVNAVSVPVINPEKSVNKLSELDQSCNIKPLSPAINPDNSLSSTLDQSYNIKFHVSGLLRDLDSSMSDSPACSKRKSLPIEELFRRNLASAVRGLNATLQSEADGEPQETEKSNIDEIHEKEVDTTDGVLKGVVLCVSRKLTNLQVELNEIVSSLGGDYLWSYDNTCTHFVFTGKSNDLAKEFREARSQGKKIVSPEWLYDCKKQNLWLNEELYPHSLKTNMSLAGEISIVKISGSQNNSVQEQKEKQPKHEELLKENDTIDFNKQLNELLVAAKSAKKRQSKRLVNSLCTSPVNEVNPIQKYPRHFSDAYVKSTSLIENNAASDEPDTCSQHSQSYPITWDDPTGRMEREKIAARAA
ncbi:DNA topoisomerase 2-binding protein 1, partial [Stegodyphus mimosarum]